MSKLEEVTDQIVDLVDKLKHQGDFDAHASTIRVLANATLFLLDTEMTTRTQINTLFKHIKP